MIFSRQRFTFPPMLRLAWLCALAALLLAALPASAAINPYQIRGNAVAGANDITRIAAGAETLVFDNYPGGNAAVLAQCPDGFLYYMINGGAGANALYRFNPQTPEVAPVQLTANSGTGDAFRMMCSSTGVLYVIPDTGVVWTINTTTGIGTSGPTITGEGAGGDAAFDSSGQLWIIDSSRRIYRASVAGGAATPWCTTTYPGAATPATLGLAFPTASTTTVWVLTQSGGGLANSGVYQFTLPAAPVAGGAGACTAAGTLVTNVAGSTATGDLTAIDVAAPSVIVTKTDGVTTYVPGGTSTYTVTITNNSAYPVTYTVTDNQPANVTFGNWTCTPAAAPAGSACGPTGTAAFTGPNTSGTGNTITGTRVRLAAGGGSATYTIPVTYAAGATGAITNTASVAVAAWLPTPTGVTSAADTDVQRPSVAKTFGAASIVDGATTTLVFTLTNSTGNPAQSAISLGDTLPTGLQINAATPAVTYSAGCSGPATVVYTAGTRVLSGLTGIAMSAGTASCTVTVAGVTNVAGQVNASCAATPAAFTNLSASVTSTNATNTSTNQCLVVTTTPPTVAKAFAPATIAGGGISTLTITLSNANSVAATLNAAFTDTLPAGLVVAPTPNAATTCAGAGPVVAAAGGSTVTLPTTRSIPAGAPGSCTVTVDVTAATGAAYANTIPINALNTSVGTNAAAANATLNVFGAPTISKAFGAATISSGGTTTLTFTITNPATNPGSVTGINFNDVLPVAPGAMTVANATTTNTCTGSTWQGRTGVGAFGAPAAGNTEVRLTGLTLAAGASCTVSVVVTAATSGTYNNVSGAIAATGPVALTGTTANASLTVLSALVVGKSFVATNVAVGGTTTMTITLQNTNSTAITGASFTDTYPAGLTGSVSASAAPAGCTGPLTALAGSLTLTGGTIPANTTCTYSVVVTGVTAGAKNNSTGAVTTINAGSGAAANATLNVFAPPTISKAFGAASISSGGTTTLTFTITNPATNPANVTGINFNDVLPTAPGAMTVANATTTNTCAGSTWEGRTGAGAFAAPAAGNTEVRLTGLTLAAGASCTVSVVVTAIANGAYNNVSGAIAATSPLALTGTTANASLTVNIVAPTIAKSFLAATIPVNGVSVLTFTLSNSNPIALTGMDFTDTYPAGMVNATPLTVGGTCAGVTHTATAGGNTFNVTGGTIPAGAPGTCTITVRVTSATLGAYNNTSSGVATTQTPLRGTPSNTATLTVSANSLSVNKSVTTLCDPHNNNNNPKAIPGAFVRYQITISNAAGAANSVNLTTIGDVLDPNLTFDPNLRTGSPTACATSVPENALGNGFRLSCAGGTRACNTPVFYTSAADADAFGIAGSTITLTFGDGPAGTKALPTEAGYGPGELKPGESVTIRFNAIIK